MIRLQLPLSKSLTLSWEIGWDHDPEPIKIQEVIPFSYLYYLYISKTSASILPVFPHTRKLMKAGGR